MRREFGTAWALFPFAKGGLSRPWDTTVRASDASLSRMGVAALTAPLTVVKNVGSISERWRFTGLMCANLKPLSALDEEVGNSDFDVFQFYGLPSPVPWYSCCVS